MKNIRRILLAVLLVVFSVTAVGMAIGCDRHHRMRQGRTHYVRNDNRHQPPSRHQVWVDRGRGREDDRSDSRSVRARPNPARVRDVPRRSAAARRPAPAENATPDRRSRSRAPSRRRPRPRS